MSGTGLTFTGVIGCGGAAFPTVHYCREGSHVAAGSTSTVTMAAPTGVQEGDLMVACVGGGSYIGGSSWTFSPASGWTALYVNDLSDRYVVGNLYSKIADANDEAGTTSYTWSLTVSGGASGLRVIHTSWPTQFGTTASSAAMSRGASSMPSPGGDWQLAFVYERTAGNGLEPTPNPAVTSDATLLCSGYDASSTGYRAGNMRVYASNNEDPITAAWTSGIDFVRRAFVVASITT